MSSLDEETEQRAFLVILQSLNCLAKGSACGCA